MAAFLAGKLIRENNGRFGKACLGKRGRNLLQRRKRKLSESVEIVESAKHPSFLSRTWRNILRQGETSTGAMVVSS